MDAEMPFEGNPPNDGDEPAYEWLDEWLCEYVDGTMDPSLEAVFEQYVEANPELKAHVQRLKKTRELLCNCGGSPESPADPNDESEVRPSVPPPPRDDASDPGPSRVKTPVGIASAVVTALVLGFAAGIMVVGPMPTGKLGGDSMTSTASERGADAPLLQRADAPLGTTVPEADAAAPFARPDSADRPSFTRSIDLP